MSWFTKIFSSGVKDVSDSIFGGLDKIFTSDEQRLTAEAIVPKIKAQLQEKLAKMENQLETFMQGELSKRHANDMQSDSWLSKNIRPLTLIFITALLTSVLGISYGGWIPAVAFTTAIVDAWLLVLMFYFGGRSGEKVVKIVSNLFLKKGSR